MEWALIFIISMQGLAAGYLDGRHSQPIIGGNGFSNTDGIESLYDPDGGLVVFTLNGANIHEADFLRFRDMPFYTSEIIKLLAPYHARWQAYLSKKAVDQRIQGGPLYARFFGDPRRGQDIQSLTKVLEILKSEGLQGWIRPRRSELQEWTPRPVIHFISGEIQHEVIAAMKAAFRKKPPPDPPPPPPHGPPAQGDQVALAVEASR